MWKVRSSNSELSSKETKDNQTYYLKIGIQKFSSQEQIDRNGEVYWRYWTYEPKEVNKEAINQTPTEKYQQRLEKTQAINNHVHNSDSNSS